MPDIMKKNCNCCTFGLLFGNLMPFRPQYVNRLPHEMHGANRMIKSCVARSGINKFAEPELPYPAQALKPGMLNDVEYDFEGNGNKSVNRVVNELSFIQVRMFLAIFM